MIYGIYGLDDWCITQSCCIPRFTVDFIPALAGVQELTAITSHLPGKFEFVYAPKVQAGLMASLHMRNSGHVNHVSARLPGIFTRTLRWYSGDLTKLSDVFYAQHFITFIYTPCWVHLLSIHQPFPCAIHRAHCCNPTSEAPLPAGWFVRPWTEEGFGMLWRSPFLRVQNMFGLSDFMGLCQRRPRTAHPHNKPSHKNQLLQQWGSNNSIIFNIATDHSLTGH